MVAIAMTISYKKSAICEFLILLLYLIMEERGQTLWYPKTSRGNAEGNISRIPKYACKYRKNAKITVY